MRRPPPPARVVHDRSSHVLLRSGQSVAERENGGSVTTPAVLAMIAWFSVRLRPRHHGLRIAVHVGLNELAGLRIDDVVVVDAATLHVRDDDRATTGEADDRARGGAAIRAAGGSAVTIAIP